MTTNEAARSIRCILSDVDGVMTDGRITYDNRLVETKSFSVKDGVGIKLWMRQGFGFGILTARQSKIVTHRAAELGITAVRQGYEDKWPAAQQMIQELGYAPEQTCFLGDDLPDLPVMRQVALSASPADAASDVLRAVDWPLQSEGGRGVVRELIERLLRGGGRWEDQLPV